MRSAIELPDVEDIALIFEDSCLIVVTVQVVRAREEGHDGGETCRSRLSVHPIAKTTERVNLCEKHHPSWSHRTQHLELHGL